MDKDTGHDHQERDDSTFNIRDIKGVVFPDIANIPRFSECCMYFSMKQNEDGNMKIKEVQDLPLYSIQKTSEEFLVSASFRKINCHYLNEIAYSASLQDIAYLPGYVNDTLTKVSCKKNSD
ncbi:hypothetical protein llap_3329 [Limosa lapponica baueri]|uniref:Uncharacterized protein n=1 Tax=Limosa lapponica baueri TaxID=1758121 RepID=A0A2I0UJY0_LIMLA|nr:hypothetical protein llap_3329 [Limosa lapponica baueri]